MNRIEQRELDFDRKGGLFGSHFTLDLGKGGRETILQSLAAGLALPPRIGPKGLPWAVQQQPGSRQHVQAARLVVRMI